MEQVITPALELAEEGFPLSQVVQNEIVNQFTTGPIWEANGKIFKPEGRLPQVGDRIIQSALADTFKRLIDIEHRAKDVGVQPQSKPHVIISIKAILLMKLPLSAKRKVAYSATKIYVSFQLGTNHL
ncbi:MAG: hypothetical protein CM1200mP18_17460 [Gammaproteobacteria bacterium]|nr:MAG: hypothetical protein CM1200mP18_17460 [Gammaproteobacteria bacterium]